MAHTVGRRISLLLPQLSFLQRSLLASFLFFSWIASLMPLALLELDALCTGAMFSTPCLLLLGPRFLLTPPLPWVFCSAAVSGWPGGCQLHAAQTLWLSGDFTPEASGLCNHLSQPGMFPEDKLLTKSHQILPVHLDDQLFTGSECQSGQVVIESGLLSAGMSVLGLILSFFTQKLLYFYLDALLKRSPC